MFVSENGFTDVMESYFFVFNGMYFLQSNWTCRTFSFLLKLFESKEK